MAVRLITFSTGRGPISDVQNPDTKDFLGNSGDTPLMLASIRLDLDTNQDSKDKTRNEENFEDGDFQDLRPDYDWRTQAHHMEPLMGCHAHHMVTGYNAPHNSVPKFLTGGQSQNDPLPRQLTQPQTIATHISPDNTLPMIVLSP